LAKVRALVLRTAGTNCDWETVKALELAGAEASRVHINRVLEDHDSLDRHRILVIPGGFSYGDDIAAGTVLANEISNHLQEDLRRFVERGGLILGICNGFQVLVKARLLPGFDGAEQLVTLTNNDSNRFEDRWVYLRVESDKSAFLHGDAPIYLPVAHGEGKFVPADEAVMERLNKNRQVVLRYVQRDGAKPSYPENPNGSVEDVAGICDETGQILGLMPHPERHIFPTQHPRWTREGLKPEGDGMQLFRNAVEYVS